MRESRRRREGPQLRPFGVFSLASGARPPVGESHEQRSSFFVASFVDKAPDKARDEVSQSADGAAFMHDPSRAFVGAPHRGAEGFLGRLPYQPLTMDVSSSAKRPCLIFV